MNTTSENMKEDDEDKHDKIIEKINTLERRLTVLE